MTGLSGPKAPWSWYMTAALCFALDRFLKIVALSGFSSGPVAGAKFTLFMNHGIAFGIPVAPLVFWPAAVLASVALMWSYANAFRSNARDAAILSMIMLGAASNLYDRVWYEATVDYFLFFDRSAVNLADGMIIGGLIALIVRDRRGQT